MVWQNKRWFLGNVEVRSRPKKILLNTQTNMCSRKISYLRAGLQMHHAEHSHSTGASRCLQSDNTFRGEKGVWFEGKLWALSVFLHFGEKAGVKQQVNKVVSQYCCTSKAEVVDIALKRPFCLSLPSPSFPLSSSLPDVIKNRNNKKTDISSLSF